MANGDSDALQVEEAGSYDGGRVSQRSVRQKTEDPSIRRVRIQSRRHQKEKEEMTEEGRVKEVVKRILKQAGIFFFMPVAGRNIAGIPDFVCCVPNGLFFAIECKANKRRLTPLQEKTLREINEHHGFTFVAWPHNLESLQEFVNSLIKHT